MSLNNMSECYSHPSVLLEWDGYGLICPRCALGEPSEITDETRRGQILGMLDEFAKFLEENSKTSAETSGMSATADKITRMFEEVTEEKIQKAAALVERAMIDASLLPRSEVPEIAKSTVGKIIRLFS